MPPTTACPTPPESWLIAAITGCTRGVLAGQRRALRTVLAARFGPLAPATHARIAACDRLVQLDAWLRAAATAPTLTAVWRDAAEGTAGAMAEDTGRHTTAAFTEAFTEDIAQDTTEAFTEDIAQDTIQNIAQDTTEAFTKDIAQDISAYAAAAADEPAEHAA